MMEALLTQSVHLSETSGHTGIVNQIQSCLQTAAPGTGNPWDSCAAWTLLDRRSLVFSSHFLGQPCPDLVHLHRSARVMPTSILQRTKM